MFTSGWKSVSIVTLGKRGNLALQDYSRSSNIYVNKNVSVVALIKKAKIKEKKEKRHTVFITTAAVCALIASGLIISQ